MKSLTVFIVTFVVFMEVNRVKSGVEEKSCKEVLQDVLRLQVKLMVQCGKTMKFKNGKEKSKKLNCILRCAMIKGELINSEGQVTADSVDFLLHQYIPPSMIVATNETFYPCMQIGLMERFKPVEEDEYCRSYDPFIQCFMDKAANVCPPSTASSSPPPMI